MCVTRWRVLSIHNIHLDQKWLMSEWAKWKSVDKCFIFIELNKVITEPKWFHGFHLHQKMCVEFIEIARVFTINIKNKSQFGMGFRSDNEWIYGLWHLKMFTLLIRIKLLAHELEKCFHLLFYRLADEVILWRRSKKTGPFF